MAGRSIVMARAVTVTASGARRQCFLENLQEALTRCTGLLAAGGACSWWPMPAAGSMRAATVTEDPADLSRLLVLMADEPDTARSLTGAGVLRQAARTLVEQAGVNERLEGRVAELSGRGRLPGCEQCGDPIDPQAKPGPPARFCKPLCRQRAWRSATSRDELAGSAHD